MARPVREHQLDDLVGEMMERHVSRRTLLARGRDLGLTVAASSFLTACASAAASRPADLSNERVRNSKMRGAAPPPRYLVMIIVDAARADYLTYTELPNVKKLMQRGTYYDRAWVGQLESVTPASHASIGSGCHPTNNGGILGFWWEDSQSGTTFNSVPLDGSDPDALSVLMRNAGAPTMAEFLKRHDSTAKVYAASGQKFYAADAAGGPYADYISYFRSPDGNRWGPLTIPGRELPAQFLNEKRLWRSTGNLPLGEQDGLVGDLALQVVHKEQPRIVILNLPEMDWPVAHIDGGPMAPSAVSVLMRGADDLLGKLVNEYDGLGILQDTVFIFLGDHGVTPLEQFVNRYEIKNAMQTVGTVISHDTHTGSFGWMEDVSLAPAAAAAVEYANIPYISAVYYLSVDAHGRQKYLPAPNTASAVGSAVLGKAFQYLCQTMSGATAPHVVCMYRERTGTLNSGGPSHPWRGDHGGASWGAQSIPMVIAGPGVRPGMVSHYPARLVDLAPTAMRLLGAPYPRTDGVVLADCMSSPQKNDVLRQASYASHMVPYAAALRRESSNDTAGMPPLSHRKLPKTSPGTILSGPGY